MTERASAEVLEELEKLRRFCQGAENLLLERARQAEELVRERDAALRQRDDARFEAAGSDQILEEVKAKLIACGLDMSSTPPMFYPEAVLTLYRKVVRERDGALAIAAEQRRALERIQVARTEGGCSTGEAMSKAEAWARDALALTPTSAVLHQRARKAVVDAAKAWRAASSADQQKADAHDLADAVDELRRVEGL